MPITGSDVLLYEKKNRIVTITLNRPERMNSLSLELLERLAAAWVQFRDDEDAWVAVVTATGDKAFCTGFDLIDQAERDKKGETAPLILPKFYPHQIWKPIIAAVNGYAVAGGWWLAQCCDGRISAEHAECGIGETRWNMPAEGIRFTAKGEHGACLGNCALGRSAHLRKRGATRSGGLIK